MAVVSKLARLWRRGGARAVIEAASEKILRRHASLWFDLPLCDAPEVVPARFDGRIAFDRGRQVLEFIECRAVPGTGDPRELEAMRARGHLFAALLEGEEILGYMKLGWDRVYVLDYELDLRMPAGAFFILDVFVAPEHRGRGAAPFMVSATSLEMRRRGFSRGVMHVRTDNTPMLRTCARTGYRRIGRVDFASVLGWPLFRPHPRAVLGT